MIKANDLKIELINWLLKKESNIIIGNEVRFSSKLRRADLLMIKKNKTFAFEIKSDRDDFRDIKLQLEDYIQTFDYTILVITPKFRKIIGDISQMNIGIYLIEKNSIHILKKPPKINHLNKDNLLYFFSKQNLIHLINKPNLSKKSIYDLRLLANKKSLKEIRKQAISILTERYNILFSLFNYDTKNNVISKDDLITLTGNIKSHNIH